MFLNINMEVNILSSVCIVSLEFIVQDTKDENSDSKVILGRNILLARINICIYIIYVLCGKMA